MAPRLNLHLPRRTVRLKLTALYGALFLLSGAGLLAITYGLVVGRPITQSFGLQAGARGGVKAVAVPPGVLKRQLTAYSYCMRSKGVPNYPLPKLSNGGKSIEITDVVPEHETPAFEAADRACLGSIGKVTASVLPGPLALGARTSFQEVSGGPAPTAHYTNFVTSARSPVAISAALPTPQERADWLVEDGLALGIMALVSVGLGWVVSGRALRPVRAMTATARQISEENLDARLAVAGPDDELKELGDTFDGLLGRLEGAFDAHRRFVANAAHELRTPLAMMRTSLDVALGKPNPPAEIKVLARKLEEGMDHAENLLDNLLVLARSQRGALGNPEPVSLPALAQSALQAESAEVARLGLSVVDATSPADVMGNEVLLARMVANVVGNSVRHNVPGGFVRLSSGSKGKWARLVVENSGPVLAPERVAQLGQPFYRPGTERIANGNGSGLGLSIAAAVAAAHGGAVVLRGLPEGGLQVVIEIPARAEQ